MSLLESVAMAVESAAVCQGANLTVPLAANGGSGGGGPALTWFQDADGFGDVLVSQESPTQPSGSAAIAGDCDDGRPGPSMPTATMTGCSTGSTPTPSILR